MCPLHHYMQAKPSLCCAHLTAPWYSQLCSPAGHTFKVVISTHRNNTVSLSHHTRRAEICMISLDTVQPSSRKDCFSNILLPPSFFEVFHADEHGHWKQTKKPPYILKSLEEIEKISWPGVGNMYSMLDLKSVFWNSELRPQILTFSLAKSLSWLRIYTLINETGQKHQDAGQ